MIYLVCNVYSKVVIVMIFKVKGNFCYFVVNLMKVGLFKKVFIVNVFIVVKFVFGGKFGILVDVVYKIGVFSDILIFVNLNFIKIN